MDLSLNAPQAEAVAHVEGPLLVFAGAGSGKTRVITYRIANLVATHHVHPSRILAVTFTNKAAGEMRSRIEKLLGGGVSRDLWVGTFHATCARILRQNGKAIGLGSNFIIYDGDDQRALVSRILKDEHIDDKRFPPRAVLSRIMAEKQEGRSPSEMEERDPGDAIIASVFREYQRRLGEANAVDFEDLIGKVVHLAEDPELGQALRKRFDFVLVDEFQDTNRMQYRLVKALSSGTGNLCVVGDDDQSIYRWRGADVRNIRGFRADYPDVLVVKLEENYRSTNNIVKAALGVIAASTDREPKELFTSNDNGEPVDVFAVGNEREEAALVVRAIEAAREEGVSPAQVAVFYRVHAQSRVLEEALRSVRIPYQVIGGMRFFERAEVKDALAYLRVLVNPKSDVDLLRIINTPTRGIGDTTIDRLASVARSNNIALTEALALDDAALGTSLGTGPKKKLREFRTLLLSLRAELDKRPSEVLDLVLNRTGYRQALNAERTAESDARLENLLELGGSLEDFEAECEASGEEANLELFLERVSLATSADEAGEERVSLMTVHAAKGLEFEWVALTGMEEEMFPYRASRAQHEEIEEERRLAYVAMTRARKRLVLTHASIRQIFGTTFVGGPSRFIFNIPEDVISYRAVGTGRVASLPKRISDPDAAVGDWGGYVAPREAPRHSPYAGRSYGSQHRAAAASNAPSTDWGGYRPQPDRYGAKPMQKQAAPESDLEAGARYVDREFFADESSSDESVRLRRGSRVRHERFGEGQVLQVTEAGEPAVVAYFPGWGEKKVLARFLKIG